SKKDRRVVMLALTPAGREILNEIGQKMINHIAANLKDVPNSDLLTLQSGLQVLQTIFVPFVFRRDATSA
ncbi:MAG: hypothetical protein KC449_18510, partial [Anaerolineales bacterium]|nr:hypothetical protein [Anaerolineales bacterium]